MMPGLYGRRMAQHLGLVGATSLVLKSGLGLDLALTHLEAPNGLGGPSAPIKAESAHIITVHLERPGLVKDWGMWIEGHFRPVTFWDLGGIDIVDLRSNPIALRESAFDSVHIYIPHETLFTHLAETRCSEIPTLQAKTGVRDEVILRWIRTLLPFFGNRHGLPTLAMNEMVSLLLGYVTKTFGDSTYQEASLTGGLALWQKRRATQMMHALRNNDLTLAALANECGLSPSHFARAFKKSFGIPAHQYLIRLRVEMARNLLLHSDLSLISIALECGFADQSAFNRSFRSITGTAPGAWKRQQRAQSFSTAHTGKNIGPQPYGCGPSKKLDHRSSCNHSCCHTPCSGSTIHCAS